MNDQALHECQQHLLAKRSGRRSFMRMIAVTVVFIIFCYFGIIDRIAGFVLVALLLVFGASLRVAQRARRERRDMDIYDAEDDVGGVPEDLRLAGLFLVAGLAALPAGAHLTIEGAVAIARTWSVSETAIALTVVALGTSLPELATAVMSAVRGHTGVAIGNIVGSNIFNILAIIGATALIAPITVPEEVLSFDVWAMLTSSMLVLLFATFAVTLRRASGFALTAAYIGYIVVVFRTGAVA